MIKRIFHAPLSLSNLFLCRVSTILSTCDPVTRWEKKLLFLKISKRSVLASVRACRGRSYNLWLLHIPLHGPSIMLVNGLATGVHSSADNIVATATQYPAGIGAS